MNLRSFSLKILWAMCLCVCLSRPAMLFAGSHTWNGAVNGLWSVAGNWSFGGVPTTNEGPVNLTFQNSPFRLLMTNDIPGLTISNITMIGNGYILRGTNVFQLTGRINNGLTGSTNTIACPVALAGSNVVDLIANTRFIISGRLSGSGQLVKVGAGPLRLASFSDNTFTGGTIVLQGNLELACGFIFPIPVPTFVPTIALPGPVTIGLGNIALTPLVILWADDQIANNASVTVRYPGHLDLNDFDDTIGSLTIDGGNVTTSVGTLTLNGDVNIASGSGIIGEIYGRLSLGGATRTFGGDSDLYLLATVIDGGGPAGIVKSGSGSLSLYGSNSFTGAVLVNDGTLSVIDDHGLGAASGGVTVADGALLRLSDVVITNETLTLNGSGPDYPYRGAFFGSGTNDWTGTVVLASDSAIVSGYEFSGFHPGKLTLSGSIIGPGALHFHGLDRLILSGATDNSFAGGTVVTNGTLRLVKTSGATAIPGPLQIGPGFTAKVELYLNNQIANNSAVTVRYPGQLDLFDLNDTIGSLTIDGGNITTGVGTLTLNGNVNSVLGSGIAGQISGRLSLGGATRTFGGDSDLYLLARVSEGGSAAGIVKTGSGTLLLSSSNSFTGAVLVNEGQLSVGDNHSLGASSGGVTVADGALLTISDVVITNETLTLNGSGPDYPHYGAFFGYGTNDWTGTVVLASDSVIVTGYELFGFHPGKLTLSGSILGPGALHFDGLDRLILSGTTDNSFTGGTVVTNGTLRLAKTGGATAIPGPLQIGPGFGFGTTAKVELGANNQIPNNALVSTFHNGQLDLGAFNETIGPLTMNDGSVQTAGGTLIVNGAITNNGNGSSIGGTLSLNGATGVFRGNGVLFLYANIVDGGLPAGITKEGTGYVYLSGINTFSGPVQVNAGMLFVGDARALGGTNAGTVVASGATLRLDNVSITNESLTLNGSGEGSQFGALVGWQTNLWTGPVTLATSATIFSGDPFASFNPFYFTPSLLTLSGVVSGPGNLSYRGNDRLRITGAAANTYFGTTTVTNGIVQLNKSPGVAAIPGALTIGDGSTNIAKVELLANGQLSDSNLVTLLGAATLDLVSHSETIGGLTGNGVVLVGNGAFSVGVGNADSVFAGEVRATGGNFTKSGTGKFTFAGTGTNGTFSSMNLASGALRLDSTLNAATFFSAAGTELSGNGVINAPIIISGNVSPGASPGKLRTGSASFSATAKFLVELNDVIPGTGFDQLAVTGSVSLGGSELIVATNSLLSSNRTFVIIANDSSDTVVGQFAGLPEGGSFISGKREFLITYAGGDGNDVAVIEVPATSLKSVSPAGHGSMAITGMGARGGKYTVEATDDLGSGVWQDLGITTADGSGNILFTDNDADNFSQRFYRLRRP